jgi:AcrR family transcriptional regulator
MIYSGNKKENVILKAATKVFAGRNFHTVTMDEIAKVADVGKGTLYRYYKNKEDLYFNILNKGLFAFYNYLLHETNKEKIVKNKLYKVIYCTLYFFEKNAPFVKIFLQEEVRFREERHYLKTRIILDNIERLTEELINEGQRKKIFKNLDIKLCTSSLIGMLKGFFLSEQDSFVKLDIKDAAESLTLLFLEGIKK